MSTATALTHALPRRNRQAIAQQKFLRRRQKLAAILESALDPRYPLKHGLRSFARIPGANRGAVGEPLEHIVALLRDPSVTVGDRTLRRVLAFVTDPRSPAFGPYPNQAGFAAHALAEELHSSGPGRSGAEGLSAPAGRDWGDRVVSCGASAG